INTRPWRRLAAPATAAKLDLEGPGILRVEARAFLGKQIATRPPVAIAVREGGELLARSLSDSGPARAPTVDMPPPAFPPFAPLVTGGGEWVGERVVVTLPVYPGRHSYQIDFSGGPLVVRAAVARYRPRLGQAAGPEGYMLEARRGLGKGPA